MSGAEAADRAGHTVRLLDLMFASDPLRAIESALRKASYDIIGLSVRNIDNNDMREPAFILLICFLLSMLFAD
jgi:hypothetical protein